MKTLVLIILSSCFVFGITPLEIAKKSKQNTSGFKYSKNILQMILVDINKNESIREIESWTKEGDEKNGDLTLIEFKKPLDVKGVKFLTHEKLDANNDQWLYLPALKRVKRISSSNKSGSFMGSEFSYEDISSREIEKYNYQDKANIIKFNEEDVYVYERYPKDENSGYTKLVVYTSKDEFLTLRIDYYDRKNELLKTANYTWKGKINNTYRVSKISMENFQNKKSTILNYLFDEINISLDDSLFTKRTLQR